MRLKCSEPQYMRLKCSESQYMNSRPRPLFLGIGIDWQADRSYVEALHSDFFEECL